MKVVADSTSLIGLCQIGLLSVLHQLFGEVCIAPAVYAEVVEKGKGKPGSGEVKQADWIRVGKIRNSLAVSMLKTYLDPGEAESIVLAAEIKADLLILDEKNGREIAEEQGIKIAGTAAILKRAAEKGLISDLKSALDKLQASGFRLSRDVYNACLGLEK